MTTGVLMHTTLEKDEGGGEILLDLEMTTGVLMHTTLEKDEGGGDSIRFGDDDWRAYARHSRKG